MHPFAKARERTRALNAAKLDKIFAKPFVDSLEGHIDAVEVLTKPLESLTTVASGSWDGGAYALSFGSRVCSHDDLQASFFIIYTLAPKC
jgi:WD repeat and SOF domain-containing protein 1